MQVVVVVMMILVTGTGLEFKNDREHSTIVKTTAPSLHCRGDIVYNQETISAQFFSTGQCKRYLCSVNVAGECGLRRGGTGWAPLSAKSVFRVNVMDYRTSPKQSPYPLHSKTTLPVRAIT